MGIQLTKESRKRHVLSGGPVYTAKQDDMVGVPRLPDSIDILPAKVAGDVDAADLRAKGEKI